MAKRNVLYVKPEEPAFLKRMKQQIGYQEPTKLDAKFCPISNLNDDSDEYEEREDEKPQVVQLKKGDLTEEEAKKFAKDEAEKPADLNEKIIFKVKKKKHDDQQKDMREKQQSKKKQPAKSLLSFDDNEDGD